MQSKAYARAGVDISLGNRMKADLPELLASASRPEALGEIGGFGGLFALNAKRLRRPVLVSSVDGVGTKLKVAFDMNRHDTIGQDLVNHCVNDIAVLGAEPLFFLDYLGAGKLKPGVFRQIIAGFALACAENRCALIGGETAQMPGFYQPGEYDVSGTIVGVVERDLILDGKAVKPGDAVIGVASTGLHTNGYTLARKILFDDLGLRPKQRVKALGGRVGDALLAVHRSYLPLIQSLLRSHNRRRPSQPGIKAMAHITGGGFYDNVPRSLPSDCDAAIDCSSWPTPPIFDFLQTEGGVSGEEMHHVFNMGIGLTVTVGAELARRVVTQARRLGYEAWRIGEIAAGTGVARVEGVS